MTDAKEEELGTWKSVESYEAAQKLVKEHETNTVTKFSVYTSDKSFGKTDLHTRKHKIRWTDEGYDFDGIPFIIVGGRVCDCQHGKDRKVLFKEKKRKATLLQKKQRDPTYDKSDAPKSTKKLNCQAQIKMREIIRFPEFKIDADTKWKRAATSERLRKAITAKTAEEERQILLFIPGVKAHKNHVVGEKHVKKTKERKPKQPSAPKTRKPKLKKPPPAPPTHEVSVNESAQVNKVNTTNNTSMHPQNPPYMGNVPTTLKAPIFRQHLKELHDLSFFVDVNDDIYNNAFPLLKSLHELLAKAVPKGDGLNLEPSQHQPQHQPQPLHQPQHQLQPQPYKRKGDFINPMNLPLEKRRDTFPHMHHGPQHHGAYQHGPQHHGYPIPNPNQPCGSNITTPPVNRCNMEPPGMVGANVTESDMLINFAILSSSCEQQGKS